MPALRNILVGYDGFEEAEEVAEVAVEVALEHGATLHLVHVAPPPPRGTEGPLSPMALHQALVESRTEHLIDLVRDLEAQGVRADSLVVSGRAHVELMRAAAQRDVDAVVVSDRLQHREGERGFGPITTKLMRSCPQPVMAVRRTDVWRPVRIGAAVDVDPWRNDDPTLNERILQQAARFARRSRCPLVVLHAWAIWGEHILRTRGHVSDEGIAELRAETERTRREAIDQLVAAADLSDLKVEVAIVHGEARRAVPQAAKNLGVDLLVMGTVSRQGLPGLLIGNTAERILHALPCSALTVKPEGFECPIRFDGSD